MHTLLRSALLAAAWAATTSAHGLAITSVSPQGEVARIRQVVVKFDEAAIRFGDAQAAAPVALSCSDAQAARGSGRWNSDREWVFEFEADLPPGVRCTVTPRSGLKSPSGADLVRLSSYFFNSGGPFVQSIRPGTHERIDEEQFFALVLNGPATAQSIQDKVWCAQDGVGERIPVRLLAPAERAALLKALRLDKQEAREPLRIATLACTRRLAPGTRVQIVYGQGVATPSGIANTVERRFAYQVREPFAAEFSCERENAQAACLPLRPMTLRFNAPVARKLAAQIALRSDKATLAPQFDKGEGEAEDNAVTVVSFPAPLAEQTAFAVELPRGFQDTSGRPLRNADSFPLKVQTAPMPPLAKFAAAPFGIIERYAEGKDGPALLPMTLRNVEPQLAARGLAAPQVTDLQARTDAEIIGWLRKVQRYNEWNVPRKVAQAEVKGPLPKALEPEQKDWVQARMVSLLGGQASVKTLPIPVYQEGKERSALPAGGTGSAASGPASASATAAPSRPFEVVGIPLTPGFHVLEVASPALGAGLLDARHGAGRTMYVRTAALVTNLAVHFKLGRENALAWVTTLDRGQPVAGSVVRVSDCAGKVLATGTTNAQGITYLQGLSPQPPRCPQPPGVKGDEDGGADWREAYFVSARAATPAGEELAFTWSDWQRGIEPWRFNLPTSREPQPDRRLHTILDRSLLRAGETVSMKHIARSETRQGFGVPARLPATLVITHVGSGQQFTQPLAWRKTATGGASAESSWPVPPAAKLGQYEIALREGEDSSPVSGSFRVEEFRLPVLEGRIAPLAKGPLIDAKAVPTGVQVNYVQGGAAANLPVRVSALVRGKSVDFPDFEGFSFQPPRPAGQGGGSGEEEATASQDQKVIADKLPLTLDRNGAGTVTVPELPAARAPRELVLEASYADPNGEVQTLRHVATLWPAGVVAGIKTEGWVASRQQMRFQALALGTDGKPAAGVPMTVKGIARVTTTSRKRMVGGFYTYDNKTELKDLGQVCSGKSDARGLLLCETQIKEAGEVELVATATDNQGLAAQAAATVWVTRQGELWFGGENHDRIDLLPEKKTYLPGETARLQVRMPFRHATALVAVEREGILQTTVVQLRGDDPTISLQVQEGWGPNAYVSVLALRGRLREVPWYSFFTWGIASPREWWRAFRDEGREWQAPTALVDLSKPAFRLGAAEIRVASKAHELAVAVKADKETYPVRGQARVTLSAKLPNGQPAAGAEVALAAVDEALLELMPNASWNLLEAMLQRRSWGVETSTAQMEIVGRRHYGRKAVPAGGGGGKSPTRELLDTLLLWNPRVQLDAQGQASVTVPLNDALTRFRIVAVADHGTGLFGTGVATIRATQDLQIISGLPPLVREDDAFRAQFTLRNTSAKAMKVEVAPRATLLTLAPQQVEIPPNEARELAWDVKAPAQLAFTRQEALLWEIEARDTRGSARDALKARQRLVPAVPLTVQQATLAQVEGSYALDAQAPADAVAFNDAKRGGLKLALRQRLAGGPDGTLPAVRDWFLDYPFICLEQKTSKAVGLRDGKLWQQVAAQIPTYLDSDGLAHYFPPREGDAGRGSDILTSYVLAATHEAAQAAPEFALPDAVRAPMEAGLIAFVEGRIQREFWSPQKDLDVRKLAALEALSRYGRAQGRMVASITIAPNQWPTGAVIDWLAVLQRVKDVPERDKRLAEAQQVLRARLSYNGTRLSFANEQGDYWWWLMVNGDVNAAKLMATVMDQPAWKDELPRLAQGLVARQQRGVWATTTANLWGGLALEKFSRLFEATPVAGSTRASFGTATASLAWASVARGTATTAPSPAPAVLPWPPGPEAKGTLAVTHQGAGKPWLTVQSLAALDLKAPVANGYTIKRTVTPVEQAAAGKLSRGDVLRVTLEVNAAADMTWVVLSDPLPGGATILGGGLGRDSQIATQGEKRPAGSAWPAFEERSFEAFRAYYEYVPRGGFKLEYTLRLNNVGDFALPPTRVEAMYAPEVFGALPNARVKVEPGR